MYLVLISQIEIQSINSIIIMPELTVYSRHKIIYCNNPERIML